MAFKLFDENSKITWWQYILIGVFMFWVGYAVIDGDLGRAVITIGWGPVIVGVVKLFKKLREK